MENGSNFFGEMMDAILANKSIEISKDAYYAILAPGLKVSPKLIKYFGYRLGTHNIKLFNEYKFSKRLTDAANKARNVAYKESHSSLYANLYRQDYYMMFTHSDFRVIYFTNKKYTIKADRLECMKDGSIIVEYGGKPKAYTIEQYIASKSKSEPVYATAEDLPDEDLIKLSYCIESCFINVDRFNPDYDYIREYGLDGYHKHEISVIDYLEDDYYFKKIEVSKPSEVTLNKMYTSGILLEDFNFQIKTLKAIKAAIEADPDCASKYLDECTECPECGTIHSVELKSCPVCHCKTEDIATYYDDSYQDEDEDYLM